MHIFSHTKYYNDFNILGELGAIVMCIICIHELMEMQVFSHTQCYNDLQVFRNCTGCLYIVKLKCTFF